MSFRDNLQYLRASRDFTQERLAMLLGVSRQAISKWESGKAYPEMDKLLAMCDLFGCTLDDLVLGDVRTPGAYASTLMSPNTSVRDHAGGPSGNTGDPDAAATTADTSSSASAVPIETQSSTASVAAPVTSPAALPPLASTTDATGYDAQGFYEKLTGGVCGVIMLVAAIVGLVLLFGSMAGWLHGVMPFFWLPWPIGGVLCGVASCVIGIFRALHDRNR